MDLRACLIYQDRTSGSEAMEPDRQALRNHSINLQRAHTGTEESPLHGYPRPAERALKLSSVHS